MVHDPLSLSEALRTRTGTVFVVVSLLVIVYSIMIIGQALFGLIILVLPASLYLTYRFLAALDSIADGVQRIADGRDREVDEADEASKGPRFDRSVDSERPETETH